MNQANISRQLQEHWDEAITRATEGKARRMELDEQQLNAAAGLPIQAGLQAGGLWGSTHGCSHACQSNEAGCGP